jgi:hypothetical protein
VVDTGQRLKRLIRLSAVYDTLVAIGFAVPGLSNLYIGLLDSVNRSLGLGGSAGSFPAFAMLFVNLMGVLALTWVGVRLYRPEPFLAVADVVARTAFAILITAALFAGAPVIIVGLAVLEIIWIALIVLALLAYSAAKAQAKAA